MRALGPIGAGLLAAALAAGCGDTLVDGGAEDLLASVGCGAGTVSCELSGALQCVEETATRCGNACADCTAQGNVPPGAVPACLPAPGGGPGACGFECTGGFLKCASGCCAATALAAGERHACAITQGGGLSCWGSDFWGQVRGGAGESVVLGPHRAYPSGVTAVAAGQSHTCAVVNGAVACWGWHDDGQTAPPAGLAGVTALAAGQRHTCALVGATGQVRCWGSNALGQTAGGTPVASGAVAISSGRDHACALLGATGAVVCWGANDAAQLGDGSAGGTRAPLTTVASGVAHLAAGVQSGCVALANPVDPPSGQLVDSIRCWGAQPGPLFSLGAPQLVPAIPRKDADTAVVRYAATGVAAGRTHVCVLRADAVDGIECFGPENGSLQLGQAAPATSEALAVPGSGGARAVAAGWDHTCAIWGDGSVRCWGKSDFGQVGTGVATDAGSPVVEVSGR